MAGGEGTRLRPVTCALPKPLVPILDKPVMQYTLELLARHGVRDVVATLHFMPGALRERFGDGAAHGLRLRYSVEDVPLGTAGSVRAAADWLDETFVVISGDALTDIDLTQALAYHRRKGADVTVITKAVDLPVEYGVVISGPDGRIQRFAEKPAWSEVFSDTVNTGIYIMEPPIIRLLGEGQKADFARDLFPRLMREGGGLYACPTDAYWCDIGTPAQYLAAQADVLNRRVHCDAPSAADGIYIHPGARTQGATLHAPCVILPDAVAEPGSVIGPDSVVCRGALLRRGAHLSGSMLQEGAVLGAGASAQGAVICPRARIGSHAHLEEGAVIGEGAQVCAEAHIAAGVSVWPAAFIAPGAQVCGDVAQRSQFPRPLFGEEGIEAQFNQGDMTPADALDIAAAFAGIHPVGAVLGVATWGDDACALLREAVCAGILSAGCACADMESLTVAQARFGVQRLGMAGALHITCREGDICLRALDHTGLPLQHAQEKAVENAFNRRAFRQARHDQIRRLRTVGGVPMLYANELPRARSAMPVHIHTEDAPLRAALCEQLQACALICVPTAAQAHCTLLPGEGGDAFALRLGGRVLRGAALYALLCALSERLGYTVDSDPLAERALWLRAADRAGTGIFADALHALVALADAAQADGVTPAQYAQPYTGEQFATAYADCPLERRGALMRTLLGDERNATLGAGVRLGGVAKGGVVVRPDRLSPGLRIYARGADAEFAHELALTHAQLLEGLARPQGAQGE